MRLASIRRKRAVRAWGFTWRSMGTYITPTKSLLIAYLEDLVDWLE